MPDTVIKVHNLSKLYRIGASLDKHRTLRDALVKAVAVPFRRRVGFSSSETIWALKNVSFEVKTGEVIGIIGRNGAGKTTLLKILSRITEPTEGYAEITGRVRSLLEVGTGFHLELTGRENIFLNGAILGMKRREIQKKFDDIVSFAEVDKFLDTPVKHYSSGMYVRLAFAVAAHLEPEILLVDEVLAVGDVAFQKKCLGKMGEVAQGGRTVFFVSHNMAAIRNLCSRTLLFDAGKLILDADTPKAITAYLDQNLTEGAVIRAGDIEKKVEGYINRNNPTIRLKEIALLDQNGLPRNTFYSDEAIKISVTYECLTVVNDLRAVVQVTDEENRVILTTQNCDDASELNLYRRSPGLYRSQCTIAPNTLGQKRLYITVHLINIKIEHLIVNKALGFDISFSGYNNVQYGSYEDSFLRPQLPWKTEALNEKREVIDGR